MLPTTAGNNGGGGGTRSRSKSSVFRSFIGGGHKRNNSDGANLPSSFATNNNAPNPIATSPGFYVSEQNLAAPNRNGVFHVGWEPPSSSAQHQQPQQYGGGGRPAMAPPLPPPSRYYPPSANHHVYALGEMHQNRQDRSPERERGRQRDRDLPPPSPTKGSGLPSFSTISLKALGSSKDGGKSPSKSKDGERRSPSKPKKAKSATNLGGLLRPKSMKNLKQRPTDDDGNNRVDKDKENRTPPTSLDADRHVLAPPPIYAQFASQLSTSPPVELPIRNGSGSGSNIAVSGHVITNSRPPITERPGALATMKKPRPKSFQSYVMGRREPSGERAEEEQPQAEDSGNGKRGIKRLTWGRKDKEAAAAAAAAAPTTAPKSRSASNGNDSNNAESRPIEMPVIDHEDIDKHLEAMLDRRNIPENQRYKMRNLSNTIKMEFIRQDWAEMQAKLEAPGPIANEGGEGRPSVDVGERPGGAGFDQDQDDGAGSGGNAKKKKHGRGLSLTIVRGGGNSSKSPNPSPTKKKGDSSLGRHFRTKSSESLVQVQQQPTTPTTASFSGGGGFFSKVKGQQLPGDFVVYLRKVQKPELVEVGKLHKLRLLLRNETVAWIEEFIRQGGMKEIVELLHRIMALEWREEHEDALLHEVLLCLKALCTTDMALQYLHSIHITLFPALLHMIFDPEKKGPSEFTTRNIITSILFTYIQAATPAERISRSRAVLGFLRDPEPKEDERPVDFVLEMRKERPYRVWNKEVLCVTKEVFWIFLHNLNIVALPSADSRKFSSAADQTTGGDNSPSLSGMSTGSGAQAGLMSSNGGCLGNSRSGTNNFSYQHNNTVACNSDPLESQYAYMARHFPQERPPVPAAPYVGGVEWDATNYLASHLDLMNAILACTGPTAQERNHLRAQLRISGWERCLGGTLRMCKEKFYGAVHDGLRTWVAAAHEDGWDVRDVRFGPPPDQSKSRSVSPVKRAAKKEVAPPPKIEMPKLDFGGGESAIHIPTPSAVRNNDSFWLS
ncbi:GTPase-binding protein rid1 [Podospora australis]|uniref:GTPase-binding protein rid1 n=1 Tax=Podospora australis TaxID=1536484 RepID=A0AAN6WYW1_9PEZI|nr:GTPase-binding protein rid1 [Podospora australis]